MDKTLNILLTLVIILILCTIKAEAQNMHIEDYLSQAIGTEQDDSENCPPVPLEVITSEPIALGTIAPGMTRSFPNPEPKALIFVIRGERGATVSINTMLNLSEGDVKLMGIEWQRKTNSGFSPISSTDAGGNLIDYRITLDRPAANGRGETELRVYPRSINADSDASSLETVNFAVTLSATYIEF